SKEGRDYPPVALAEDGTLLATGSWDGLSLWDAATGALVARFARGKGTYFVSFSPGGRGILSQDSEHYHKPGFENDLLLWETASGQLRLRIKGQRRNVRSVAF